VAGAAAILGLAFFQALPASAVLGGSPSFFQSNDGNMVASGGQADWASVTGNGDYNHVTDLFNSSLDNNYDPGQDLDTNCPSIVQHKPPNKDDFTDVASYFETATDGDTYLYGATIRASANGNAHENIELKQEQDPTCANSTLKSRTVNDKMIAIDYLGGGSSAQFKVFTWVDSGACESGGSASAASPCWGADEANLTSIGAEGAVSPAAITGPNNSINGNALKAGEFAEFGVNLVDAHIIPSGGCASFTQVVWSSRSSGSSFVSQPKDVTVEAARISNCGSITIRKVTENGDDSFAFTGLGSGFSLQNGEHSTTTGLTAGNYSVVETLTNAQTTGGWSLRLIGCTIPATDDSTATTHLATGTVDIVLARGESVDCTYTNHRKLSPTISTQLNGSSATLSVDVGSSVYDTATLTGATADASGTVAYTAYTDSSCTLGAQDAGALKAVTAGVVTQSNALTFTSPGTFYWQAVYSGDTKNFGATSSCSAEVLTVGKKSPTATTAQTLRPNDSFALSGGYNATGNVTFSLFAPGDPTCAGTPAYTETVALASDAAATTNTTFFASAEGTWKWKVVYVGDANNNGRTLGCGVEQFTIDNDTSS
jgi:hypothetical protein